MFFEVSSRGLNLIVDILLVGSKAYFVLSICLYAAVEIMFDLKFDNVVLVISEENL